MSRPHDELLEEFLVDAYGDGEQLGALETGISEGIDFPFEATVLGQHVRVLGIEFDGNERRGLTARTEHGRVSLLDVIPKSREAVDHLNAYRAWAGVKLLK